MPATVDTEIKALASNLKKQDSLFNFLPKFVAKNGYPVWDKVAFKTEHKEQSLKVYSTQSQVGDSNDKGLFLVPLVDETSHRVKSYLVAKKHGVDAYTYQLYNREDLSKTKVNDSLKNNLIQTQALFGYFEKEINGINEIEITNPKKEKIKNVNLEFTTINKNNLKTQGLKTNDVICDVSISLTLTFEIAGGEARLVALTLEIRIECWESGGGGGGGGGSTPTPPPVTPPVNTPVTPPGGVTPSNPYYPYNPYNPYRNANWWDYGAGFPNPFDPNNPSYYRNPYDPYDPYNPIPYDPFNPPYFPWFPGGGGGGGIPTTGYQLTARDIEILNEIEQEDIEADNNTSPCKGTARSGNIQWAGTLEHWIIQFDYVNTVFGAEREYSIPGSSINGNTGYADLVNLVTNEIFEIKPPTLTLAGAAEVNTYVTKANENCGTANGGLWQKGINYPTKFFLNPRDPSKTIRAFLDQPGLIVYINEDRNTNPVLLPVALPQNLADKLTNFLQTLIQNQVDIERKILVFLQENPEVKNWIIGAAVGIMVGTLVEDVLTGGIGIADDWASFVIARNMIRIAVKL